MLRARGRMIVIHQSESAQWVIHVLRAWHNFAKKNSSASIFRHSSSVGLDSNSFFQKEPTDIMELQGLPRENRGYHTSIDELSADNGVKKPRPDSAVIDVDGQINGQINKDLKEEEIDPWSLPELTDTGIPWSELTSRGKALRVLGAFIKIALLLGLLYLFICSLSFLSSAFRLLGGKKAGEVFTEKSVLSNPVAGVVIGLLATVLVQSSSTSTSIVVAMVSSGILEVRQAIPIVMGANIGTSVTNTIVSAGHASDRDQFRRAFAGATVHDVFNWLSVVILLPIESASGYLYHLSGAITDSLGLKKGEREKVELLKKITKPFTNIVIQIDKKLIQKIAEGEDIGDKSLIKSCAPKINSTKKVCDEFLFHDTGMSDKEVGGILLAIALIILCVCLACIVKLLHSMLKGQIAKIIKKGINSDFPKPFKWFTGYVAILLGAGMTMLVQSSSIFTSALTPLVGIGVVTIDRTYPLTLGANIGTTVTSILAALAATSKFRESLQIALCHLFFNISGIAIWYPLPFMRKIPIKGAKFLGNTTAKYRWFAFMYLVIVFFVFPALVLGLSVAGWQILVGIGVPIVLVIITIIVINILQSKAPHVLPTVLQNWEWAPVWLRSLEPYDRIVKKVIYFVRQNLCCFKKSGEQSPETNETHEKPEHSQNGSSKPPSYPDHGQAQVNHGTYVL
ncbi:sodium-dependent phosphate transport 2B-like [Paramuricea clavata]|uniref:Sodium-dependent phosphate transport 2B-like n=1 Tax=Paramuricea clavata TaxID=317549 RepID=A0A6S7I7R4_PARCT|nr:sodium-dependent phosphate transport 2B-like [Paramuricea clavata]